MIHLTDLEELRQRHSELLNKIDKLQANCKDKDYVIGDLKGEIERLRTQLHQQNSPNLQSPMKKTNLSQMESLNLNLTHSSTEMNQVILQNNQLSDTVNVMQDEIDYLKLREKKIMYLVHLL